MARALIENSLLTHSQRLDVAIAIENGKHPAVLEHPRSIVGGRGLGSYVILLTYADLVQPRAPSECGIGAACPLISRS